MRELLIAHGPETAAVIACIEFIIGIILIFMFGKQRRPILIYMALVSLALFYDAAVLSLGGNLGTGILKPLSQLRFIFHGVFIPLLLPICAEALRWPKWAKVIVWIITAVLMAAGLVSGVVTRLEPATAAGITRFLSGPDTPELAARYTRILSYGAVVPLILAGLWIWIKRKRPSLFLAGFLMLVFSALGPATGNTDLIFLIGMFGEVFMVFFFLLFGARDK